MSQNLLLESLTPSLAISKSDPSLSVSLSNKWLPVFNDVDSILYLTQNQTFTVTFQANQPLNFSASSFVKLDFKDLLNDPSDISSLGGVDIEFLGSEPSSLGKSLFKISGTTVTFNPSKPFTMAEKGGFSFRISNLNIQKSQSKRGNLWITYAVGEESASLSTPVIVCPPPLIGKTYSSPDLLQLPQNSGTLPFKFEFLQTNPYEEGGTVYFSRNGYTVKNLLILSLNNTSSSPIKANNSSQITVKFKYGNGQTGDLTTEEKMKQVGCSVRNDPNDDWRIFSDNPGVFTIKANHNSVLGPETSSATFVFETIQTDYNGNDSDSTSVNIEASFPDGSFQTALTINKLTPEPNLAYFTSDKTIVNDGDKAKLNWNVYGGDQKPWRLAQDSGLSQVIPTNPFNWVETSFPLTITKGKGPIADAPLFFPYFLGYFGTNLYRQVDIEIKLVITTFSCSNDSEGDYWLDWNTNGSTCNVSVPIQGINWPNLSPIEKSNTRNIGNIEKIKLGDPTPVMTLECESPRLQQHATTRKLIWCPYTLMSLAVFSNKYMVGALGFMEAHSATLNFIDNAKISKMFNSTLLNYPLLLAVSPTLDYVYLVYFYDNKHTTQQFWINKIDVDFISKDRTKVIRATADTCCFSRDFFLRLRTVLLSMV